MLEVIIVGVVSPLVAGCIAYGVARIQNGKQVADRTLVLHTELKAINKTVTATAKDVKHMREGDCPTAKQIRREFANHTHPDKE